MFQEIAWKFRRLVFKISKSNGYADIPKLPLIPYAQKKRTAFYEICYDLPDVVALSIISSIFIASSVQIALYSKRGVRKVAVSSSKELSFKGPIQHFLLENITH